MCCNICSPNVLFRRINIEWITGLASAICRGNSTALWSTGIPVLHNAVEFPLHIALANPVIHSIFILRNKTFGEQILQHTSKKCSSGVMFIHYSTEIHTFININCFMLIYYCFSLTKIENISIENSDKLSVLLLSLKNLNIIQFIHYSACGALQNDWKARGSV